MWTTFRLKEFNKMWFLPEKWGRASRCNIMNAVQSCKKAATLLCLTIKLEQKKMRSHRFPVNARRIASMGFVAVCILSHSSIIFKISFSFHRASRALQISIKIHNLKSSVSYTLKERSGKAMDKSLSYVQQYATFFESIRNTELSFWMRTRKTSSCMLFVKSPQ